MHRSIPALALAAALALGGTLAGPVGIDPASADLGPGAVFYSVPWGDGLVTRFAPEGSEPFLDYASFDQWAGAGYPTPVRAGAPRYLKQPWSDVVFGQADVGGEVFETELVFEEFARAGYPRTVDRLPEVAQIVKYATSDELIVTVSRHRSDAFESRKLTFRQWSGYGFPQPLEYFMEYGIQKLSWSDAVAIVVADEGIVRPDPREYALQFGEWQNRGYPTPAVVRSFAGDRFCQTPGDDEVRYVGLAAPEGFGMSFLQWVGAGSPRPEDC
ncbi:hypothetical protein ITJ42_00960 [Clavibacter michiganensis subsp. phaseoli]|uniref:Uncharacterized protein n=1 Tax=Clavibacter phaseoli TaxID=1734031 RepID=A0A8I0S5D5_9MICO|nr:hypothetical protein [Clavibacter phaseoli]MBF4629782.1 hypothetical protein [Clavibacter phaseoli]